MKILNIFIIIVFVCSLVNPLMADNGQPILPPNTPQNFLFNLNTHQVKSLSNSPSGTMVSIVQHGVRFGYTYLGNYHLNGSFVGDGCAQVGVGDCTIFWDTSKTVILGTSNKPEGTIEITAPNKSSDGKPMGEGKNLVEGKTPENLDPKAENGGGGVMATSRDIGNATAQAALTAGVASYIVDKLGGEGLRKAQENLSKATRDLLDTSNNYQATRIATVQTGLDLVSQTSIFNASIPVPALPNLSQSSDVNINYLRGQISKFDPQYANQVLTIAGQLNSVDIQSETRRLEFKEIGKAALRTSIENRVLGWINVSDAQLKMAGQIAEMLVRVLPVTGTYTSLYEVWTGKNMFNDRPLSSFDRGLQGAMAVMGLVSMGVIPTLASGVRTVSMIAAMGEETAIAAATDAIPTIVDVAEDVSKLGITSPRGLSTAEQVLSAGNRTGKITSLEQVETALSDGLATGKIKKLPFNSAFNENPFSSESLKFIKNEIQANGVRAQTIYPGSGTSKDIFIIGRKMTAIHAYQRALVEAGYSGKSVKFFQLEYETWNEWNNLIKNAKSSGVDYLPDNVIKSTKAFAENIKYMQEALGSAEAQPTIIDIGRNGKDEASAFYDGLELEMLKRSGRAPFQ